MPDTRGQEWRRRLEAQSRARGLALSGAVVDELVSHLTDCYQAECDAGASHDDAMASVSRLIDSGRYPDIAGTRRARSADSRLVRRARIGGGGITSGVGFDIRYALRTMRRHPGFSAALVAILAIGIGATTAAYAVIDAVLLAPLPYPAADRLMVVTHGVPAHESGAFAPADWLDYASRRQSLAVLASYASWPMNLTGGGEPERLHSIIVSGEFFDAAGVAAATGRTTTSRDDSPAAPAVAVLSDAFWRRRFGGDPAAIGRTVTLNGQVTTIVGVMPPDFALPKSDVDLWMPMGLSPKVLSDRDGEWLSLIGRLQAGVSPAAAQADLSAAAAGLAAAYPRSSRDATIHIRPFKDTLVGDARRALWLGGLAAAFVLVAGLANAANLLLARATTRRDEMAVRASLGADPVRLARQLLVESGVFAAAAGVMGSALSWMLVEGFTRTAVDFVPRLGQLRVDTGVLAAAVAASALTAIAVGGSTAWFLVRRGIAQPTSSASRVTRATPLQGLLLATQIAFAMVLAAGAALVVRGYAATVRVDPGFDTSDTQTLQLTLPRSRYPDSASHVRFVNRLRDALTALPGITAAGVVSDLPFVGNATHFPVTTAGEAGAAPRMMTVRLADPEWFQTLGIPLVAGRPFDDRDRRDTTAIAILNRSAAGRFEAGRAVGQRLQVSGDVERTVVGVVGDIRHAGLHEDEGPVLYVPYAQKTFDFLNWMGVAIRARGTLPTAAVLKAAVATVDPNQPVEAVRSMTDYLDREAAPFEVGAMVVGALAGVALLLAVTGIYGLTSFIVERRARELALRVALGANGRSIMLTVGRHLGVALAFGAMAGVAGMAVVVRVVAATLGHASPPGSSVPVALAASIAIVAGAGLAAWGPARRGARIDPAAALKGG